jgi:chromosome segregation ATPase
LAQEETINIHLQEKLTELTNQLQELKDKTSNYESLQKELTTYEAQINNLQAQIQEKNLTEEVLNSFADDLQEQLKNLTKKAETKNDNIFQQITDITADQEKAKEFTESLINEKNKFHNYNEKFYLD